MKKDISEKQLLVASIFIIALYFLIFIILQTITKEKVVFEIVLIALAVATIFGVITFLYKFKLDSDYVWILILTAGILSVSYIHANETIFQNTAIDLSLFFTSKISEYAVSLLEVVFLTIISVFVISAIVTIRESSSTSQKVSIQNDSILRNIDSTIVDANNAAQNAKEAALKAKETLQIWEKHNEITKILKDVENTYFGESFISSLSKYLDSWKSLLNQFNNSDVTKEEKMIMSKLIENYIEEEIIDFNKSTFASNFGLYARNVQDIMNIFIEEEVDYEKK